jgi:Hint domain
MTVAVPCFLRGTRILTAKGELQVEALSIGDLVVTERGVHLPVKWIGRRRFTKAAESTWPNDFMPVRISRRALDERTPHTDLYLSPAHALFVDGVLIPVMHLINGKSIVQAMPEGMQEIEYFHVLLDTHEVIFAEGAAVETLLVTHQLEQFENFIEHERLCGTENRRAMVPYAPIVSYNGRRSELIALLRRTASPILDMRDPIQVAFDRAAVRARELVG